MRRRKIKPGPLCRTCNVETKFHRGFLGYEGFVCPVCHWDTNDPEPDNVPTLRPGEKQGDILSKQQEPFALATETTPDLDARQRAEEQAARDRAESEKLQTRLF